MKKKLCIPICMLSFLVLYVVSCKPKDNGPDPEYRIVFDDSTEITEDDILFYDSTSFILFLKEPVQFVIGDSPLKTDRDFIGFSVYTDEELIFSSNIVPQRICGLALNYFNYIDSDTYPEFNSDFLDFQGFDYVLNDSRIIEALSKSGLLRSGVEYELTGIQKMPGNDQEVYISMVINNLDNADYLVPCPHINSDIRIGSFSIKMRNNESHEEFGTLPVEQDSTKHENNLVNIKKHGKVDFTYLAECKKPIPKGTYTVFLTLYNSPFDIIDNFSLNQPDGRVWVGMINADVYSFEVE